MVKHNSRTNDIIINRSPVLLHIIFICGPSAIQQGLISRVVPEASEDPYH